MGALVRSVYVGKRVLSEVYVCGALLMKRNGNVWYRGFP